jgi:hypothetical protein
MSHAVNASAFGVSARFALSRSTRLLALPVQNAFAQAAFCRAPSDADIEIVADHGGLTRSLDGRDIDVSQRHTSTVTL